MPAEFQATVMKHLAVLSLACAIWLVNGRRRSSSQAKRQTTEPPLTASRSGSSIIQKSHASGTSLIAPPPPPVTAPSAASPAPPSKSAVGAVLQWMFLILLSAAMSLTAAKGTWDVFAVLLAAAVLQLGGQLTLWLAAGSGGSGASRRGRTTRGSAGVATRRGGGGGAAATEVVRAVAPPRVLLPDPRLGGVWVKDAARSDSMDEATALMRLNGIVRTAVRLIRGLELSPEALNAGRFDLAIFSVIAFFKVRESYLLDGTVAQYNRRDLRRGKHTASVAVQLDGSVVLSVSWGEPLAGTGIDHFAVVPAATAAVPSGDPAVAAAGGAAVYGSTARQPEPAAAASDDGDVLVVTSTLRLAEAVRPVVYRTTYVRAGGGRR